LRPLYKLLPAFVAMAVGVSILVLLTGSSKPEAKAKATTRQKPRVVVAPVVRRAVTERVRLFGVTRAARRATLSFTIGGRLARRPVRVGDLVRRGQLIASLDGRALRNGVRAAQAGVGQIAARRAQLARELARYRSLYSSNAIPKQQLERTATGLDAASAGRRLSRAQLREARRLLGESSLRAPFAGTITAVHLEPGEYAKPGRGVVALAGSREIEIEVEAPERLVAGLRRGQKVDIDLPLLGQRGLAGTIRSLGHAARGAGQLFPLVIALDPADAVKPGITAEVTLRRAPRPALLVPVGAVIDPTGAAPSVFAVRAGRARRLPVRVRRLVVDHVALSPSARRGAEQAPLSSADRVVVGGQVGLFEGDRVSIVADPRAVRAPR
jgi:RND family efflux transporter MFP subunit